ncbi:MAG: tetratricopeptide repeat protein, partial [Candidatus Sumerlaeaceae bacterium]
MIRSRLPVVSLIIALLLAWPATAVQAYPGEAFINELRGQRAYHSGEFQKAAEYFEKAAERNPSAARLRYNHALALLRQGEKGKAEEILRSVFDPHDAEATQQAFEQLTRLRHESARAAALPLLPYMAAPEKVPLQEAQKLRQAAEAALKEYDEKVLNEYKQALSFNVKSEDLARNFEIAQRERDAIEDFLRRLPTPPPPPQ